MNGVNSTLESLMEELLEENRELNQKIGVVSSERTHFYSTLCHSENQIEKLGIEHSQYLKKLT
jgi:hypothetical protein